MKLLATLLLILCLAACGGAATPSPTPVPAPSATAAPTVSPIPSPTATRTPTATPAPTPTRTPVPAATMQAIATANVAAPVFTDPEGRFQFAKPQGWVAERQQDADIAAQLNSDTPPGSFTVAIERVVPGLTLGQYVDAGVAQVQKRVTGYQPGPRVRQSFTLGGETAELIDYTATVSGTRLYFLQIIALRGDTAYVLTFNTQPNDRDAYFVQAQTALDSWRFL